MQTTELPTRSRFSTWILTLGVISSLLASPAVLAHNTPSEFAQMSLQELFDVDVSADNDSTSRPGRWSFSYNYRYLEIKGYRDGTDNWSTADVLWTPASGEPRSQNNFPVLPTEIEQEVHLFELVYQYPSGAGMRVSVPYVRQSTDHISIVPGYPEFLIKTRGMGDVKFSYSSRIGNFLGGQTQASIGISLPTGSIDEQGDTPRAPGNQQLPYTMQLGSGTYNIPLSLRYSRPLGPGQWSIGASSIIRTGKNDRGYRLGNSHTLSTRFSLPMANRLEPFIATEYRHIGRIAGQDDELTVPNPVFPYPASITNPDMYGGSSANVTLGLKVPVRDKHSLVVESSVPVYQNLNGPQPRTRWSASVKYQFSL